ncbi:MAG: hypothetical protein U0746_19660 [Gemmataceae bacterium]
MGEVYAVRHLRNGRHRRLAAPPWPGDDIGGTLDLEATYEETCRVRRIQ